MKYIVPVVVLLSAGVIGAALRVGLLGGRTFSGPGSRPAMEGAVSEATETTETIEATVASGLEMDWAKLGWNRFRGPNGSGISDDATIPVTWSETENLRWKTALPGPGSSSPVLTNSKVFLTCYSGYGETASNPGEIAHLKRHLCCVDRQSGNMLWTKTIDSKEPEEAFRGMGLTEHGYATNTPVTDGTKVFAFLGKSGVFGFDLDGNQLWHTSVGTKSNQKGWGTCSSLTLFNDLVIVNAAEESGAMIALNKETGEEVWRASAPRLPMTFSTPALVRIDENRTDLVIAVVGEIWGLNPVTGKVVWYATSPIGGNVSPCVIVDGDLVYAFGGFQQAGSVCVQAGGRGNVTDSHVKWTSRSTSYIATPVLVDGEFYWVDDKSRYYCQDASDGELVAQERMPNKMGNGRPIYASMIAINKKIYAQTRSAGVVVLGAGGDLKILAQNKFDQDGSIANATPAVDNGQLFLRSNRFLYCVQDTSTVDPITP